MKTQSGQLIRGALFLALIYSCSYLLKLSTLQWLLNILAPGLFVVIAIVFQPELRKIIIRLGQGEFFRLDNKPILGQMETVITAAEILSQQRRGSLVVFPRKMNLRGIMDTGTKLNAELSSSLIVTIFAFDGPLHDGALFIHGGRIIAAGCYLPLSEQQDIMKSFGTRHRAALGMSEQSDAVILIVSEESGAISLAYESKLYYDISSVEIQRKMKELLDKNIRSSRKEEAEKSADLSAEKPDGNVPVAEEK
jgi:diadenylate cyclase